MWAETANTTNFENHVLHSDKPAVVEFWASWCQPCKAMSKVVDSFAKDFESQILVTKVNVDQAPDLTKAYDIKSVPTTLLFVDGKERNRLVGAVDKQKLADFVLNEVY